MSARAAASALLLCFLAIPFVHHPAQAGPWLPARGEYSAELRGGLFTADTYLNNDGDRAGLGGRWEERSLGATIEMGWKKRVSLVIGAPFVSATAQSDAGPSLTSTGLEDLLIGARYGIHQGASALALEVDWQTPLGYNRMQSLFASPVRANGLDNPQAYGSLQSLSASLLYGAPVAKRGFLQLGAGYGQRFLSLTQKGKHVTESAPDTINAAADLWAQELLLSADLGIWIGRGLLIGGRYAGTMTASHGDLYPERTVHMVGPVLVYRVDERLDVSFGTWSTAMGADVLHRDQFYAAITFKQTHLNRLQGFLGGTKAP
jgi:hypothetical protein